MYLSALKCQQSQCSEGLCVESHLTSPPSSPSPPSPAESEEKEKAEQNDNGCAVAVAVAVAATATNAASASDADVQRTQHLDEAVVWVCDKCQHVTSNREASALFTESKAHVDTAMSAYNEHIQLSLSHPCSPSELASSAERARKTIELKLKALHARLADAHELVFDLYPPLINVCNQLKDYRARLTYTRGVVALADRVFPSHFLVNANYLTCLASTIKKVAQTRRRYVCAFARVGGHMTHR